MEGWREYASMASKYLEICKTGTLRLVVLETWLFLDYTLANLLISGLNMTGVDTDFVDLRHEMIPSFARSLQLVIKIRERN